MARAVRMRVEGQPERVVRAATRLGEATARRSKALRTPAAAPPARAARADAPLVRAAGAHGCYASRRQPQHRAERGGWRNAAFVRPPPANPNLRLRCAADALAPCAAPGRAARTGGTR